MLSGSYDHIVKIHNIRSGKLLKEFHGHTSFVNAVLFSNDNEKVMSTSSDGTLKVKTIHLFRDTQIFERLTPPFSFRFGKPKVDHVCILSH